MPHCIVFMWKMYHSSQYQLAVREFFCSSSCANSRTCHTEVTTRTW